MTQKNINKTLSMVAMLFAVFSSFWARDVIVIASLLLAIYYTLCAILAHLEENNEN